MTDNRDLIMPPFRSVEGYLEGLNQITGSNITHAVEYP